MAPNNAANPAGKQQASGIGRLSEPAGRPRRGSAKSTQHAQPWTEIPTPKPYAGPATQHVLNLGDARQLDWIENESVHLVVTSPPYFNLKKYNENQDQLGNMNDYEAFLDQWRTPSRLPLARGHLRPSTANRF